MRRFAGLCLLLIAYLVAPSSAAFASHNRGGDTITLLVSTGASPGAVKLNWTGGPQPFSVFRSTTPQGVVGPGNFIGTTNEATFDDTPPQGAAFFYEIAGGCAYNPPEVCNGLDDDCDGDVDGPGSEASCNLPHAVPACAQGACVVAACNNGWGDCNGGNADGCEIDLTTDAAHCGSCSTSCDDASLCTRDLCAASTCQHVDRKQCANASANSPVCGQEGCAACNFAEAFPGCPNPDTDGDGLPDAWEDAQAIDLNCDGVIDPSNDVAIPGADKRVQDIYVKAVAMQNAPDESDPNVHFPTQNAIRSVVAAVAGSHLDTPPYRCDGSVPAPVCPPLFACSEDNVCLPVCSTDADCTTGVCSGGMCRKRRLHIDSAAITPIPHEKVISYGPVQPGCMTAGDVTQGVNLYDLKANPANFDPKTALFTHFGVFGHFNTCDSPSTCADDDPSDGSSCPDLGGVRPGFATSGLAEFGGNDFVVSLGGFPLASDPVAMDDMVSGTFMHELGHNMGLDHGGPGCDPQTDPTCTYAPDQPRKVNYISVMNHRYQFGIPVTQTPGSVTPDPTRSRLDFSHASMTTLDESNLNESAGLGSGSPPPYDTDLVRYVSPGFGPGTRYGSTMPGEPINWKLDDPVISTPVQVNIDGFPPGPLPSGTQPGAEDWGHLDFDFQCSATFLPGVTPPAGAIAVAELDPAIAADLDILRPLKVPLIGLNQPCIDLSSQGVIPVIVYGSATFDVTQIVTQNLRVSEAPPVGLSTGDKNGDGYPDLEVQAHPSLMSLTPQNHWVVVTGNLNTGQSFQGEVPAVISGSAAGCCGPGQIYCAAGCTDPATDPDNCGACGASCSNANMATRTCSNGMCNGTCLAGYGDCNGDVRADGCETPLDIAQSNSPAAIWAGDPNPNKDLKPGYLRVGNILNCGGCGVTCDDGIACTTDVCVRVAQGVAGCGHYDRGTCATARCGGVALPPGTPPPSDPGCTAPDTDGDGLYDAWEQGSTDPYTGAPRPPGIDLDCDGEISTGDGDMVYSDPPVGPFDKDIYLTIAYMGPPPPPNPETGGHAPLPEALDAVRAAFTRQGITLHIDPVMPEVPHAGVVYFPSGFPPGPCTGADAVNFFDIKSATFDPKLRFTHRFVVFGHNSCYTGESGNQASGMAEIKGNDLIVSLGDFTYAGSVAAVHEKQTHEQAGTLLHELGHTLGLDHGGPVSACSPAPCGTALEYQKPNHISVMSYSYQLDGVRRSATPGTPLPPDPTTPWRVDFSHGAYGDLNESSLNEIAGLTGGTPPYDRDVARYYCPGLSTYMYYAPGSGPIDWSCDGVYSPSVSADIDADGTLATLTDPDEWADGLDYRFQCQPTFANGVDHPDSTTRLELSLAQATARGLRALVPCQSNADCNDGNFCNGVETCNPATGLCQPGTPPVCDDLNPCTVDTCNAANNACQYDPAAANGTPCIGQAFCVVGTVCTNGACGGGTPRDCEDGLPCTANACSEALHACTSSCTAAPCWTAAVGSGAASAPASDTAFVPSGAPSRSFVAKGNTLYAIRNINDGVGPAGSVKWTWLTPDGSTLSNFPSPVPLSPGAGGGEYIFVGLNDGRLYKIDALTGSTTAIADTRRPTCAADGIGATPAVLLNAFASQAFKDEMATHPGHAGDDLVIVVTKDQCSDSTRNRILGYYASDLSTKLVFNAPATHKVDFASDGCAIDYANNRIYCGTNQPAGGTQNTLWAIDASNYLVVWSDNAGSIKNRPILAHGRLYVTAAGGTIMAYDPAGSAAGGAVRLWSSPAETPGAIERAPYVEGRSGGWLNKILALDTGGVLRAFTDAGDHATTNWTVTPGPGLTWTSMAAVDPVGGTAYIGRSDGRVQQINLSTGAQEAVIPVSPPDTVFDPSLDVAGGAARFNRLTVASGGGAAGSVAQFCTWPPPPGGCTSDADCAPQSGQCYVSVCDLSAGACVRVARPDGTSCNDGLLCTPSSACRSGSCQSDSYASCQCVNTGDAACSSGQTCCGGGTGGGCKNLLTDSANCGSCGNVCPSDRTCSQGLCVATPAACTSPTAATLSGAASQLSGADGLAFDRLSAAGSVCAAYVTSYGYPSQSTIKRVDAGGAITPLTSPSPDSAPLNGVSVPSEGNQFYAAEINRPLGSVPTTVPGLIEGGFTPAHVNVARTTTTTFASVPFAATMFDQGPVGPALDYQTYTSSAGTDPRVYLGNWSANGDVFELRRVCTPICSWTPSQVQVVITPAGDRVTAIAFAVEKNQGPINHRSLYVGHGSTLSIYDLDGGTQSNIDLAAAQPPQTINAILNIAVHPAYGEIFVEVRNTAGNRFVLNIDAHDRSARHALDVQTDLHLPPPFVPATSSNDGRLVIMPDGQVLRFVPGVPPQSPAFESYRVTR